MTETIDPGFKVEGTSKDAAVKVKSRAATLREKTLDMLRQHPGGLTADEVADALRESILSIRPRVSELATVGKIEKTGARRMNESGMNAWVWVAKRSGALAEVAV